MEDKFQDIPTGWEAPEKDIWISWIRPSQQALTASTALFESAFGDYHKRSLNTNSIFMYNRKNHEIGSPY